MHTTLKVTSYIEAGWAIEASPDSRVDLMAEEPE